jgi:hypothetical protein
MPTARVRARAVGDSLRGGCGVISEPRYRGDRHRSGKPELLTVIRALHTKCMRTEHVDIDFRHRSGGRHPHWGRPPEPLTWKPQVCDSLPVRYTGYILYTLRSCRDVCLYPQSPPCKTRRIHTVRALQGGRAVWLSTTHSVINCTIHRFARILQVSQPQISTSIRVFHTKYVVM